MRIFALTENRRINELAGFVGITLAVLLALCLLSYSPQDAAFNVAAAPPSGGPSHNWIGPVGAHVADLFFQGIGYAAFLFPVGLFLLAFRRFRSQKVNAPIAKTVGCALFIFALPAELSLIGAPEVRGALPPGGMFGELMAHVLRSAVNSIGANVVALACIFAALLLTTPFTFAGTAKWMRGPLSAEGFLGKRILALIDRVKDWREARESEKLRKRVEEIKIAGRPAVPAQQKTKVATTIRDIEEIEDEEKLEPRRVAPVITFSEPAEASPARKSSGAEPKIAKGKLTYRLPSPTLLRGAERSERMTEPELKEYARAIEQKCAEFDVAGHVTQINPGPVVTTFELKPEAGIKYSRITGLADDLCLALKAESILIERIPDRKSVV